MFWFVLLLDVVEAEDGAAGDFGLAQFSDHFARFLRWEHRVGWWFDLKMFLS